jgi:murein DD-endopeptidase MepM/ murein hydrolase activator NlpD
MCRKKLVIAKMKGKMLGEANMTISKKRILALICMTLAIAVALAMIPCPAMDSYAEANTETKKDEKFMNPMKHMELSSGFGGGRGHDGGDYRNPYGTKVFASKSGKVTFVGYYYAYGLLIRISHGKGQSTWYAHLSDDFVKEGKRVEQGDLIGKVGTSGRSSGAHLHFEIRKGGVPQNPVPLLGKRG